MALGTAVAMAIVSLLLLLVFRSVRLGLISLVPNFVPAAMAMGLWGYAVGEVGVAASVVTAIAFGIIVDDTIHFMTKYVGARKNGLLPSESVQTAFRSVGKALVVTTVVFGLGFMVFGASGMTTNQALGLLVGMTVIIALLADFLFLPPLLMALDGTRETSREIRERLRRSTELFRGDSRIARLPVILPAALAPTTDRPDWRESGPQLLNRGGARGPGECPPFGRSLAGTVLLSREFRARAKTHDPARKVPEAR